MMMMSRVEQNIPYLLCMGWRDLGAIAIRLFSMLSLTSK
jgi:hypothetical protein